MFQHFQFQQDAVAKLKQRLFNATSKVAILLQSATGSGKTVIAAKFAYEYINDNKDHKVLIIVNRQILIGQIFTTFTSFGLSTSVVHNEINRTIDGIRFPKLNFNDNCIISMVESFNNADIPDSYQPTLILIDEAHKSTSQEYQNLKFRYPNAHIVGLTATPYREQSENGEHLSEWYDEIVYTVSVEELIKLKRLVQPKYISIEDGENAHLVNTWKSVTKDSKLKQTIIFTTDTKASIAVSEAFTNAGITAEIITAGSDNIDEDGNNLSAQTQNQRYAIFSRFRKGITQVLISVDALCEGFDEESAKFCFLYRGVGNIALYHQMVGRVLRYHTDKEDECYIVDFFGNFARHGRIEDYQWNMEDGKEKSKFLNKTREITLSIWRKNVSLLVACIGCNHIYDTRKNVACTYCKAHNPIKISSLASDVYEDLGINSDSLRKDVFSKWRIATANEQHTGFAQGFINKKLGFEVFNLEGALTETGSLLNVIFSKKSLPRTTDRIVFN